MASPPHSFNTFSLEEVLRGLILRGLGMQATERARILQRTDRAASAYALSRAGQFLGPSWFDLKLYVRLAEGHSIDYEATAGKV